MFSNKLSQIEFENIIKNDSVFLSKINRLSNNQITYYYNRMTNKIVYFDLNKENGFVIDYRDFKKSYGDDNKLRIIVGEETDNIEYIKYEYINEKQKILKFDVFIMDYLLLFENEGYKIDLLYNDLNKLDDLSSFINSLNKSERVKYELPILALFFNYSIKYYNNKLLAVDKRNILGEEYYGIKIKYSKISSYDLSELVFKVLFPDYGRDDFEEKEDVKVNLNAIKQMIDYLNSPRSHKFSTCGDK